MTTIAELRALDAAATRGPWTRETIRHAGVRQLAQVIAKQLAVPHDNGAPASTDGTWIVALDGAKSACFVGNGPRQTENGDWIAAARNALPLLLDVAEAARALTHSEDTGTYIRAFDELSAALEALEAAS